MKKEQEFIISSEELRKNQAKVLFLEELEREDKKNKVKNALILTGTVLVMITLVIVINKRTDKGIENCIKNGNSQFFCEKYLED